MFGRCMQEGFYWACACVPSGRITADDYLAFADLADRWGAALHQCCTSPDMWTSIVCIIRCWAWDRIEVCCRYGNGTARATVECNILFPFIPESKLEDLKVYRPCSPPPVCSANYSRLK